MNHGVLGTLLFQQEISKFQKDINAMVRTMVQLQLLLMKVPFKFNPLNPLNPLNRILVFNSLLNANLEEPLMDSVKVLQA